MRGRDSFGRKNTITKRENIFILIGMPMKFEFKNRTSVIEPKPPRDQKKILKFKMNHRQGVASLSSAVFHLHNACTQQC